MPSIQDVATKLGLRADDFELYGAEIAKVKPTVRIRAPRRQGPSRLVLVSAITPCGGGEGKTTTSIGLAQGLARMGESVCLALREPSLGPCFGIKGGGTGGGKCEVLPAERINLHFTGDFHAVTSAHNLLAAVLDNHLHFGNSLRIDPRRIVWPRVLDSNDRALRRLVLGLGGTQDGVPREATFDITAASEVMAMLCLAENADDLRDRMDRTLVAFSEEGEPLAARHLETTGAMLALLRDALLPNLVRTTEGVPALIHGGPFANIAHGCSSLIATRTAMHLADWTITEAGFAVDLGAEKFFDMKCRLAGLDPVAVVVVATMRSLRGHGGKSKAERTTPDADAVQRGLPNLDKHLESIACFGKRPIVALNQFDEDSEAEIDSLRQHCEQREVPLAVTRHFREGGAGAISLAEIVRECAGQGSSPFQPLYDVTAPVRDKIAAVATRMYGARGVQYTQKAARQIRELERWGYADLPVCIAKTHLSLSDDPQRRGRPRDFELTVQELRIHSGAGFLVVLTGDITRMPGLPRRPLAAEIDLVDGEIVGMR